MIRLGLSLLLVLVPIAAAAQSPQTISTITAAAQAGNADAQFALAQAYRAGRGVPASIPDALTWYRRAAAQGNARASDEIGLILFARGDRREAMPYVNKAAARGDPRALYLLGTAHFNGDYATRDWPLAYAQTERAAESGLPAAKKNLELMGRYLLAGDRAKAAEILATLPPVLRLVDPAPPQPAQAVVPPTPQPAPAPPSAATPVAASAAPRPATPSVATARPRGAWRVQLGAYASAASARTAWDKLAARVPALKKWDRRIVAAGSMQRLQAAGLPGRSAANALCADVSKAGSACFAVAP